MNSNQRTELIATLKARAQASGLNQAQIAEKSGISQPQVSRFLSGRFLKLSKCLNVLCIFFECGPTNEDQPRIPTQALETALLEAWDGSPQHEEAIIQLLSCLRPAMRRE